MKLVVGIIIWIGEFFILIVRRGFLSNWPILRFGDDSMTQFRLSDLFVCEKDEFSSIFLKESFTDYTIFDDEIDVWFQFAKKYFYCVVNWETNEKSIIVKRPLCIT